MKHIFVLETFDKIDGEHLAAITRAFEGGPRTPRPIVSFRSRLNQSGDKLVVPNATASGGDVTLNVMSTVYHG